MYTLSRTDGHGRRTVSGVFVGTHALADAIADLGPVPVEDRAGGFAHPQNASVMCIPLTDGRCALVDAEDYELVKPYVWYGLSNERVTATHSFGGKAYQLRMHRLVLLLGDDDERSCDHINHDPLDNRKANLRACTQKENMWNRRSSSVHPAVSGVKGVYRQRSSSRWCASVKANGVNHYQSFETLEEASAWVRAKREELHGEFACHE
jgi:hypothetical protein